MVDCDYCGESFGDEEAYLDHLADDHEGELGRIDRRRVADRTGGSGGGLLAGLSAGPVALVLVLALAGGAVAYVTFGVGGSGSGGGPSGLGAVHYHGTINMTVTGDRVDFSRSEYQLQADAFHFEGGDGERWHVHARDVTLGWAMGSLDINVTESSVTFEGTTYRDGSSDYDVAVTVDGEPVTPSEYVLQRGDHVRIVVREA